MMLSFSYVLSRLPQAVDGKLPPAVVMKLDVEGREVELNIFHAIYKNTAYGVIFLDLTKWPFQRSTSCQTL